MYRQDDQLRETQAARDALRANRRAQQSRVLWRMSAGERQRAMWAGKLSMHQLCEWSSRRPNEVPRIGGEFAWIVMSTPEWAEAGQATLTDK